MSPNDSSLSSMQSVRENNFKAYQIASTANTETTESYPDNIEYYRNREYQYIPIPISGKYFDVYDDEMCDMHPDQTKQSDVSLIDTLSLLDEHPFLLLYENHRDTTQNGDIVINNGSERGENNTEIEYQIVTLADVNRRAVKDMLYPYIAELATRLSYRIEKEYSDETELFAPLKPATIGYWVRDKDEDVKIHIAEYMDLAEMKQTIKQSSDDFKQECGFSASNTKIEKQLRDIEKLRNRVMHANRSLVHNRDDLSETLERIKRLERLLENVPEADEKSTT